MWIGIRLVGRWVLEYVYVYDVVERDMYEDDIMISWLSGRARILPSMNRGCEE